MRPIRGSSKTHLSLDWDSRTVRAMVFRVRSGRLDVLRAASIPLAREVSGQEPESLGRFIRGALAQARVRAPRATLLVPRDKVVLNTLRVPPTPNDELASVVRYQMERELPFAASEATLDFAAEPGVPGESRLVLVAAVRSDVLTFFQKVAEAAGLKLAHIGLRPSANLAAALASAGEAASGGVTLFVEVGPDHTEIDLISEGRLAFSRAASVRLPAEALEAAGERRVEDSRILSREVVDILEADGVLQGVVSDLLLEVMRSVEAYRATAGGSPIGRVIVAGATGVEAALCEALRERLSAPAELFSAARAVSLGESRALQLRGFSAAIGVALRMGVSPLDAIDFLQPKKPIPKRQKQMQRMRIAGAAAAVLCLAAYQGFEAMLAEPRERLEQLAARESALVRDERDLEKLSRPMKAIDAWLASEQVWIDHLVNVTRAFPSSEEMYVSSVQASESLPMDFQLRSVSQAVTTELIARLNQLPQFDARLSSSVEQAQKDQKLFTERMLLSIRRAAGAAASASAPRAAAGPQIGAGGEGTASAEPAASSQTDAAEQERLEGDDADAAGDASDAEVEVDTAGAAAAPRSDGSVRDAGRTVRAGSRPRNRPVAGAPGSRAGGSRGGADE